MIRVVLDTNVVVSGLFWRGPANQIIRAASENGLELLTSAPLLAELRDVLKRPKFSLKIAGAGIGADQLVDRYSLLATVLVPAITARIAADPDDDVVLGTAEAGNASFVISGDDHLLSVNSYRGIPILTPAKAVEHLKLS